MVPWYRSLLPNASWTRALLAPALVFIATATDRNYQTDFWHHLARGQAIVDTGQLLNHDLFTYTVTGTPFQDNNWLTQLFYYFLYSRGGLELVQLVNSLCLAAMMVVLVAFCRHVSGSLLLASGVCAFSFFGLWQVLIIRPQTFSLLLFVVLYLFLELAERRKGWLFLPPVLLALWVNLHGGFPIGLVLIGSFVLAACVRNVRAGSVSDGWGSESQPAPSLTLPARTFVQEYDVDRNAQRFRVAHFFSSVWPWIVCLAGSLLATLANPYGWRIYQYVGLTSVRAASRRIDEWVPPGLDLLVGKIWVLSLLTMLVLFALSRRRPSIRELCLLLVFLPLACGSVRMVAWWLLVCAPIITSLLAAHLAHRLPPAQHQEAPSWADGVVCALIGLAVLLSVPCLERYNPVLTHLRHARRPEADLQVMVEYLQKQKDKLRIFSRFEWSEYLGCFLAPQGKVFMDGRIEIFPDPIWRQYSAITRGRADWQDILDSYQVDYLLLDVTGYHADLLPQVERSARWRQVLRAGDAILFERQNPVTMRNIRGTAQDKARRQAG